MRIRRRLATAVAGASIAILAIAGVVLAAQLSFEPYGETEQVTADTWKLISDTVDGPGYGGLDFNLPGAIDFEQITVLRATDVVAEADDTCTGGSPRYQINVDTDGDGDFDANVFAYVELASGVCPLGGDTGDLAETGGPGDLLLRWDTSQLVPGTQITTYTATAALFVANPTWQVIGIQLVVDSGWAFPDGEQAITVNPDVQVEFGEAGSSADCKDGGWQLFTDEDGEPFKNQGDCVSSFNSGKG